MSKSIAKNGIIYFFCGFLNMAFPFLMSIYVSRILKPISIGEVAYSRNIVNYFAILSFLGIPTYGVREMSKARINAKYLNELYTELFIVNLISTAFFTLLYYITIIVLMRGNDNLELHLIVGITVILNVFNITWLYEGLEEFGFMAVRNALVKCISFIIMLLCVKTDKDIIPYAIIEIIGTSGMGIAYFLESGKFVKFVSVNDLNLRQHLKPIFLLLMVNISIEIYTLVDITMLGIMSTKDHVAYYSYASRINHMLIQITNTITMVLVPRLSFEYGRNNNKEFNRLLTKGLDVIFVISIPIIIGVQYVSLFLVTKIYGNDYYSSGIVERILCVAILISPIGYLLGSRVLLITKNELKMVKCVSIGALVNVLGNCLLIGRFHEYGASIASVIGEVVVMVLYLMCGKKYFLLEQWKYTFFKAIIASFIELGFLQVTATLLSASWKRLVIQVLGSAILYYFTLVVLKERLVLDYLVVLKNKVSKR